MIRPGCAYRKSFSSFTGCYYITAGGHPYFIDFILKKPLQQSTAQPHLTRQLLFGNRCQKLDISKIYFLNLGAELDQPIYQLKCSDTFIVGAKFKKTCGGVFSIMWWYFSEGSKTGQNLKWVVMVVATLAVQFGTINIKTVHFRLVWPRTVNR